MIRFLLFLAMTIQVSQAQRIIAAGNTTSSLVPVDTRVRLSCTTDKQWFFCLWHSPSADIQCAIQYDEPTSVCKENPRIQLIGGSKHCDIILQVQPSDHGRWMCLVNDMEKFDARKSFVNLNVGVESLVQVTIEGADVEEGVLNAVEGDSIQIRCSAEAGYPAPSLTWYGPQRADQHNSLQVYQSSHVNSPGSHTVSTMQIIRYVPILEDTNKTISCLMLQTLDGTTHFTRTISHRLNIEKRPITPGGPLVQGVTLISWILILIILVILSCSLAVALLVRRRNRKRKQRKLLHAKEEQHSLFDEDPEMLDDGSELTPRIFSQRPQYNEYRNRLSDCNGRRICNPTLEQSFLDISRSQVPQLNGVQHNGISRIGEPEVVNGGVSSPRSPPPSTAAERPTSSAASSSPDGRKRDNNEVQRFKDERELVKQLLPEVNRCPGCQQVREKDGGAGGGGGEQGHCPNCDQVNREVKPRQCSHRHSRHTPSTHISRSLSASDLSISYSVEDLTKSCRLLTSHHEPPTLISPGSVPHLDRLPLRTLVNPTKSLVSLNSDRPSKRRRRRTEPSSKVSKSTNSVFDCDEGCFQTENHKSQQLVTITTGPVII